jgi:hypothetical protein
VLVLLCIVDLRVETVAAFHLMDALSLLHQTACMQHAQQAGERNKLPAFVKMRVFFRNRRCSWRCSSLSPHGHRCPGWRQTFGTTRRAHRWDWRPADTASPILAQLCLLTA